MYYPLWGISFYQICWSFHVSIHQNILNPSIKYPDLPGGEGVQSIEDSQIIWSLSLSQDNFCNWRHIDSWMIHLSKLPSQSQKVSIWIFKTLWWISSSWISSKINLVECLLILFWLSSNSLYFLLTSSNWQLKIRDYFT